ncbi:MAG TPA: carbon-nitrogen hydrolase family protein [Flavitalea sp.]|nr:carbon-nitrogen hydrolase family protein [Flavitalea sp.]
MNKQEFFPWKTIAFLLLFFFPLQPNAQVKKEDSGKMRVASCQFPVSSDIASNLKWIEEQMIEAKLKKATAVHFPECALSGYPGVDMPSMEGFDWVELKKATDSVLSLAKKLQLWVILGSVHQLSGKNKPHNSLYVINAEGEIIDRYDKRFCTSGDLKHFSPGDHFVNFKINGIPCGLLICYDVRFPELYRSYSQAGARFIFQSFHNARAWKGFIHPHIMPVTAQANAASNYFYMSLTNSCVPESWPCHFITPDGLIQNKLTKDVPGVLISDIDIADQYYDASMPYRSEAISGKLNSGTTVKDSLSSNRRAIR